MVLGRGGAVTIFFLSLFLFFFKRSSCKKKKKSLRDQITMKYKEETHKGKNNLQQFALEREKKIFIPPHLLPPPPLTPAPNPAPAPVPPLPPILPPPLPDGRQQLHRVVDAHGRQVQRRGRVLAEGVARVRVGADAGAEARRAGVEEVEAAAVAAGGDELALGADEGGCFLFFLFWGKEGVR